MTPTASHAINDTRVLSAVGRYWGFDSLRPLQAEAIAAALAQRDSLVVMPTGGGKSLCYQVPPVLDGSLDIVVSPLISLMKDQVDGLRTAGYPAACLHSGLSPNERREAESGLAEGRFRLLFLAPERLVTDWFLQLVARMNVRRFAIDEAHCISHWGHDFRPEYRQLSVLRQRFPQASLHAFTATATPRVRDDIAAQLGLRDPEVLVGCFDRPNLIYRILPMIDRAEQTIEVLRRHSGEAAIVYCLSRKETEHMAAVLQANGIRAAHYHAGLSPEERHRTQDAFSEERLDVVVATVAFGMGIDRSNVRCVLHAALPKSIEHYQQETGRAGRDGLEAECVLLYTAADAIRWDGLLTKRAEETGQPAEVLAAQLRLIKQIQQICSSPICRHRALSEHFGQAYEKPNCGACDFCLGEIEGFENATITAQKILSCVARTGERFGVGHVVEVLQGANTDKVRSFRHDQLSVYGLLKEMPKKALQSMVYQLVDQGLVTRTDGEKPILKLNEASWAVMRGQREVQLVRPKDHLAAKSASAEENWEGVDRGLFDDLRQWRRGVATERNIPPFTVMHDTTLMELARSRPTTLDAMRRIPGLGEKRLADFGQPLGTRITAYCEKHGLSTNQLTSPAAKSAIVRPPPAKSKSAAREAAFLMFQQQRTVEEASTVAGRAVGTVWQYLEEFVTERRPESIDAWVTPAIYRRVSEAAANAESGRLKPIHEKLGGEVTYEEIRVVLAHLKAQAEGV
ncbi:MAG TPA: DNA helicase RecQ [Pirellulales bacterium]|nr:DNA helicase RecQ [Pirellulales bacterium]